MIRAISYIVLYPISLLYALVLILRRYIIKSIYPIYRAPIPVISIGNIAVGGTGKTPITSYILSLCENMGCTPCVISRGYGGSGRNYPIDVHAVDNPAIVGDEPYMLSKQHTHALCFVDPVRTRAMRYAYKYTQPSCFILDDAMQHIYVARDSNIVILTMHDIMHRWNAVLPFGRWREHACALHDADVFCVRATPEEWQKYQGDVVKRLGRYAKPIYAFHVEITGIYDGIHRTRVDINTPYSIVCGIGNPDSFYQSILAYIGSPPQSYTYCQDHASQHILMNAITACPTKYVICTQKDIVKLTDMPITKHVYYTQTQCVFDAMLYTTIPFSIYCKTIVNATV